MTTKRIPIHAYCQECHGVLTVVLMDIHDYDSGWNLIIERCSNCIQDAYDHGVIEGALNGAPKIEQEGEDFDENNNT